MRKKILLLIFIFAILVTVNTKDAQAKIGLSVEPSLVTIQIKPGKAITKAFTIKNSSGVEKQLVVRLLPFEKADNAGNPALDVKTNSPWLKYFTLSNTNIKFDEPFTVKENSSEQIILSISIPENANVEDFYATLLFSTYTNTLPTDTKGTIISASIGANLLVTITSEVDPKTILKVDNIKITSPNIKIGRRVFVDSLTPITYELKASNIGNHITQSKGTTSIIKKDEVISLQGILPQYIISKNTRQLLNIDGGNTFKFTPNPLSFGWHNIKVNIKSDNTNSNNSVEFFIFPFKISIGLVIGLFLLKTVLQFSRKKVDIDI